VDIGLILEKTSIHGVFPVLGRADARNRTGDPFITSEVLYQLSYVGICRDFLVLQASR
jgi:hypothetical protein